MSSFVDPITTFKPRREPNGRFAPNPNNTNPPRKRKPKVKQGQNLSQNMAATPIAPVAPIVTAKTFYTIALDCSGSMRHLRAATVQAFNARIEVLKNLAQQYNQDVYVSLLTFGTKAYQNQYTNVPLSLMQPLTVNSYNPNDASTALLDGVGAAIERCKQVLRGNDDAFLIEVITDGGENSSVKYDDGRNSANNWLRPIHAKKSLPALIAECHRNGFYTIVFQVPRGEKAGLHHKFAIPLDNINEWETTEVGTHEAEQKTSGGLLNYMSLRATGAKMSQTFYKDVDLSQVSTRDLQKCTDLSHKFRMLTVDKECVIKEFVESKTGKPFVIGSAYYQLTKEELIQPTKEIAIMEKGKHTVWGGQEARKVLGLVAGANNKVNPYNMGKYVAFIKSTSVNRILVRGTRLLLDASLKVGEAPTWGKIDANNMFTV